MLKPLDQLARSLALGIPPCATYGGYMEDVAIAHGRLAAAIISRLSSSIVRGRQMEFELAISEDLQ